MCTRVLRFAAISVPLLFVLSTAASANTCNAFATYTCHTATPNIVRIGGTASGLPVGNFLTGTSFTVSLTNSNSARDVVIIAAFLGAPTGTLNGTSFTSLNSFPEGGALGAITGSLQSLGLCGTSCTLSFGFVDLHTALTSNGSVTVNIGGVPRGTVLYGLVLDPIGVVKYITPNSAAAILQPVPEPGTLTLLGTGLIGLAGIVRRRMRG